MKKWTRAFAVLLSACLLAAGVCAEVSSSKCADSVRKVIIDTDVGSDDAAALVLAASDGGLDILGVTVLYGNVPLDRAAANALMTLEVCGCHAPVYIGASRPLVRERKETISVHGEDGMGDQGLIHPLHRPEKGNAVDFILDSIRKNPEEVEIIALGPLTDLALAVRQDSETVKRIKRIWVMGTAGFGSGNASPVAEFNVYVDPDAYDEVLRAGLPMTIIGLDCMEEGTRIDPKDMDALARGNARGRFMHGAFTKLFAFYRSLGQNMGVPDALAVAAAIWPEYVLETTPCYGAVCLGEGPAYGQVVLYRKGAVYEAMPKIGMYNLDVVSKIDSGLYKKNFMRAMTANCPPSD